MENDTEVSLRSLFELIQKKGKKAKALPDNDPSKKASMDEYAKFKADYNERKKLLEAKLSMHCFFFIPFSYFLRKSSRKHSFTQPTSHQLMQ